MSARAASILTALWVLLLIIVGAVIMFSIESLWGSVLVAEMIAVLAYMSVERVQRYREHGEWL